MKMMDCLPDKAIGLPGIHHWVSSKFFERVQLEKLCSYLYKTNLLFGSEEVGNGHRSAVDGYNLRNRRIKRNARDRNLRVII